MEYSRHSRIAEELTTVAAAQSAGEGRRERRSRELRTRIYETARSLFLKHGFDATTVGQIAEAADIAPATFFNHFQNKAAILDTMTAEVFEHLQALVDEQIARPVSTQDQLLGFAERVAEEISRARNLAHDVLLGLMQIGLRRGDASPHLSGIRSPFAGLFVAGQANGHVRRDYDPEFLAEVVIGALNGAITNWLNDPDYPLADRLRETATLMGEAIQPGRSA